LELTPTTPVVVPSPGMTPTASSTVVQGLSEPSIDSTLVLYTTTVYLEKEYWAFKTWPPLPFLDSAVFDTLYGERQYAADMSMFFMDFAPKLSPDGRYVLVPGLASHPEAAIEGTGTWLIDLELGEVRQLLPDGVIATWSPTSDAIAYVKDDTLYELGIAEGAVPTPLFQDARLWSIYAHWSPDGRWIAALTSGQETTNGVMGTYWLVPPNGGAARELMTHEVWAIDYSAGSMSWSPDGQYLLIHNRVFDLAGRRLSPDAEYAGRVSWLPNDSRLLMQTADGLSIVTIAGEEMARVSDTGAGAWAFSRDGRRLAYIQDGEAGAQILAVYDLEMGTSQTIGPGAGAPLRWSAEDSHLLMSVYRDNRVQIVSRSAEPDSDEEILVDEGLLIEVMPYPPNEPRTDSTPRPVLFARADDLYRADVVGDAVEQLTVDGSLGWGMETADDQWRINALSLPLRISPDGRRIAFSPEGATIMVVDVRIPAAEPLSVPGSAVFAWSPDSSRLAYAVHEGSQRYAQLIVRDFDNDAALSMPIDLVSNISALAWSPDGRDIAFGCCFEQDYSEAGEYQGTSTGQLWTIQNRPLSRRPTVVC
jgi:Tol biopolymer transport system component